jgi:predicted aspartyl protease
MAFPFGPPSGGEPVPRLAITLADDAGHATPPMDAVLDTGADGTIVPLAILRAAGLRPSRIRKAMLPAGLDQPIETVIGYEVTLHLGDLEVAAVEVYGSRLFAEIILGRNVLNRLVFHYDGPRRLITLAP